MSFDLSLINNDIRVNPDGSIRIVTDTPKLRQDIIKVILTPLGSSRDHPWYGCAINEEIIGKHLPFHILREQIKISITESLNKIKQLQFAQSSRQPVSLAEIIQVVAEVTVNNNVEDPRIITVTVTVLAKNLAKIEEYFTIANTY